MTKASRLIRLIMLLRANRSMDCGRLSRELGISERTVYRDIDSLSDINVPIYYDGSGYHLQDNSLLPILNLDTEEYFLLKTLLESPPSQATSETRALVKQLSTKLEAVLSSTVRVARKTRQSPSRILMNSSHDPKLVEKWMPLICEAIKRDQVIEIEYDSLERGKGLRKLEPYQIIFRGRAYYLIAYALEHGEYRQYRLDRFSALTISKQHFLPRTDYNAEQLYAGSWEFVADGEWHEVEILLSGRAAKIVSTGKRIDGEIVEQLPDGRTRYSVRIRGLAEISRWVVGFGKEAEVVRPQELRDSLRQTGEYLSKTYSAEQSPLPRIHIEERSEISEDKAAG